MRALVWLSRIAVFALLFAVALNNQHPAVVHGLFGAQWQAPMVIIGLVFFAAGCVAGVLAMLWRLPSQRRPADASPAPTPTVAKPSERPAASVSSHFGAEATVGGQGKVSEV